jgi:hypothetical protein
MAKESELNEMLKLAELLALDGEFDEDLEDRFEGVNLTEIELLAAEVFGFNFEYYAEKYEYYESFSLTMPNDIALLIKDENFKWDIKKLAKKLKVDVALAKDLRERYQDAKKIVMARNAATSFAQGVKKAIESAVKSGLESKEDIAALVEQVCFRTADFSYLLNREGAQLWEYSDGLRDGSLDCEIDVEDWGDNDNHDGVVVPF